MKVSVIIPAYNNAGFLPECLQSALSQDFPDFEVVVVDDGSTDNTRQVVDSFQDPRVQYHYQENQGIAGAYNKCIALSRGEYIAFLDSDDRLMPDSLEPRVHLLDRNPGVGFCYGDAQVIDEKDCLRRMSRPRFYSGSRIVEGRAAIKELLFLNYIETSTVMLRRSCLTEVGLFDPRLVVCQDEDLWIRLGRRYPVGYIAQPLAQRRIHPRMSTRTRSLQELEGAWLHILGEVFYDVELGQYFRPLKGRSYAEFYRLLEGYTYGKDNRQTRYYLLSALRHWPQSLLRREGWGMLSLFVKSLLPIPLRLAIRRVWPAR